MGDISYKGYPRIVLLPKICYNTFQYIGNFYFQKGRYYEI